MASDNWEGLLPATSLSSASRSDLLGQLAASMNGGGGTGVSSSGSLGNIGPGSGSSEVSDQLASLAAQITGLTSAQQEATSALQDNTQAVTQNTSAKSGSGSTAGTVEGAVSSVWGGGLSSLSPLIGGLLSLFGGGGGQTLATPWPYMLPWPVQSEAGVTASAPGQVTPVSYGSTGQPRAASSAPQVTIQVNALDSQSFLDHSDDIAMAVKQAILNSSSLNDVIAEL
jgi:hypothetical protein